MSRSSCSSARRNPPRSISCGRAASSRWRRRCAAWPEAPTASWRWSRSRRATGLVQPGSLVRWGYRVRLPDDAASDRAATALIDDARGALPEAGWEVRSRSNASPQLERNISRFTQFLSLVGLAALLVGGVGVATAAKSHVDRRVDVIAAVKALVA